MSVYKILRVLIVASGTTATTDDDGRRTATGHHQYLLSSLYRCSTPDCRFDRDM